MLPEQTPTSGAPPIPPAFEHTLRTLLQNQGELSEHQLMQRLVEAGFEQFQPSLDPLHLFQSHFMLFHLLYRLRDQWWTDGIGQLEIHTLSIHLVPMPEQPAFSPGLVKNDPLRAYYLDFDEYRDTQEDDVIDLLTDFWQRLAAGPVPVTLTPQAVEQAKQTLHWPQDTELSERSIQQQYRRLSQKHHPDKGGDADTFHTLTEARAILLRHIQRA
ncbi:DNA-J related domain-containing protein [Thiomicrospira sp. WB1]|uniref:DNA-J related domain-containing protein n=1 Tax=Thiomicrospira sp. WB1 TaxID=1685380 RepID=UPI0007486C06|nr:DNA-J related domain-containing protein [Thiomicrospira sp. WB1]KUJ71333.1 hypothetical protein AVO41_07305 [Thiomicrospira sp. WB1]